MRCSIFRWRPHSGRSAVPEFGYWRAHSNNLRPPSAVLLAACEGSLRDVLTAVRTLAATPDAVAPALLPNHAQAVPASAGAFRSTGAPCSRQIDMPRE